MPQKPKQPKKDGKSEPNAEKCNDWVDDQKNHEYYYDDAHGYETYHPDDEDEDN